MFQISSYDFGQSNSSLSTLTLTKFYFRFIDLRIDNLKSQCNYARDSDFDISHQSFL